ncbi:MAG: ATP-dependent DNA ligase [Verrucomicrobiota bacterium]
MKRFTELFVELDRTNRTNRKVDALETYFRDARPEDAVWALYVLMGARLPRAIPTGRLREWIAERAGLPLWLVEESYDVVGDLAETLSLLLRDECETEEQPLHRIVTDRILPLKGLEEDERRAHLFDTWGGLTRDERFVFNKLITGNFRVGVSRTLVCRALSRIAEVDTAVMSHRLMGDWSPERVSFQELVFEASDAGPGKPYPFYLAHAIEQKPESLGPIETWQAEWKWDGIRAQWIFRHGEVMVWSRGEELMTDRFPELAEPPAGVPEGTVLDGEILVWRGEAPRPFFELQKRIGRKKVSKKMLSDFPVIFMVYDVMEWQGQDVREEALGDRRRLTDILFESMVGETAFRRSEPVGARDWAELKALRATSRERGVEGFMLKRRDSAYGVGREKGAWWKWKVDPMTIDAVLIYAQQGHGRRAGLYTDYSFGLWQDEELVTVAKAYSGLTDEEIRRVDRFIRANTLERHGPVRVVQPELVFELAFENVQRSPRHKSGVAVRFPRMNRWREDKQAKDADTLDGLKSLLPEPPS